MLAVVGDGEVPLNHLVELVYEDDMLLSAGLEEALDNTVCWSSMAMARSRTSNHANRHQHEAKWCHRQCDGEAQGWCTRSERTVMCPLGVVGILEFHGDQHVGP